VSCGPASSRCRAGIPAAEPASTFVALQHPVGLPFYGLGIAALFFYRNRLQTRQRA